MSQNTQILIVEDDADLRTNLESLLQDLGHAVVAVSSAEEGLEEVKFRSASLPFDLLLLDVKLPGMSGLEMLKRVRESNPLVSCVMMTAHGNIPDAVEAIQSGALSYLEKPLDLSLVETAIAKAIYGRTQIQALQISAPHARGENLDTDALIRLAQSQAPLLFIGPNGTGKQVCARALHSLSTQRRGGFLSVNAADMTAAKFFGEQGTSGVLQELNQGTLLIRNVELLSADLQVKLFQLLDSGFYEVITTAGVTRQVPSQTRIHFSTTLPREELVKALDARLFDKISRFSLYLAPLQARITQKPALLNSLVEYFIDFLNKKHSLKIRGIRESALALLATKSWTGNLRDLEATLERAMIFESSEHLSAQSFNPGMLRASAMGDSDRKIDYHEEKERFEREFIIQALKRFDGRINQTVLKAGIPKNTLLRKIRKYGIEPREFGSTQLTETH